MGYRLNRLDEPVFMAVPKPMLTEFGIHYRLESCVKCSNQYSIFGIYRVTRRVFSEPVTSKLHLLYTKNLAGQLKTPKVIRISAMHANFSHSPVHSGPICFHMTKNLKLPSGTNKTK